MRLSIFISFLTATTAYLLWMYFNPKIIYSPVIKISNGKLQGKVSTSRNGQSYFEYLRIPYALPPLNELRYEPPQIWDQDWEGVRDATYHGAVCLQIDHFTKTTQGEEDCLFLNVAHAPEFGIRKPVLVFIHGGAFSFGSGNMYRPDYFMDNQDIVLVTLGYRLSSFGFLNSGDSLIRGNMGLKDQTVALRWIKQNIRAFGGNPNDVTIFGESAGGCSVHMHMLSPMSANLFHKAIAQSGIATMSWAIAPNPKDQFQRFAQQMRCNSSNSLEVVKCLKSKSAKDLVSVHHELADMLRPMNAVFLPTIEKDFHDRKSFLTEEPKTIIESGRQNHVPFLAGVNSVEGLVISGSIVNNITLKTKLHQDWAKELAAILFIPKLETQVAEKIKRFYLNDEEFNYQESEKQLVGLTNIFSDWVWKLGFHNGIMSHLKHLSPQAPIYIYYYDYHGDFSLSDIILSLKGDYHPIVEILWMKITNWLKYNLLRQRNTRIGACHGDELAMEFYVPGLAYISSNDRDYEFSKHIVQLIVQFVKLDTKSNSGIPPVLRFLNVEWPPLEKNKSLSYMKIDLNPETVQEPFMSHVKFWHSLKELV